MLRKNPFYLSDEYSQGASWVEEAESKRHGIALNVKANSFSKMKQTKQNVGMERLRNLDMNVTTVSLPSATRVTKTL